MGVERCVVIGTGRGLVLMLVPADTDVGAGLGADEDASGIEEGVGKEWRVCACCVCV